MQIRATDATVRHFDEHLVRRRLRYGQRSYLDRAIPDVHRRGHVVGQCLARGVGRSFQQLAAVDDLRHAPGVRAVAEVHAIARGPRRHRPVDLAGVVAVLVQRRLDAVQWQIAVEVAP